MREMKKAILIGVAFSMLFLSYLFYRVPVINADLVSSDGYTIAYQPYIVFPSNYITYDSNLLTLNVSFHGMIFAETKYYMTYSLDGKAPEVLPLVMYYYGSWIINPDNWERNHIDGSVLLPELSEGAHEITVYLTCHGEYDNQTVYFIVKLIDKTPPLISNLSVENKTYNSTDIPLVFNINETTSHISYSLDNNANVTINGNTTLIGLTEGSHNLIVYANDTVGNMGVTENIFFTISKPEPFPTTLVIATSVIIAVIAIGLFVYFRKHKPVSKDVKQNTT